MNVESYALLHAAVPAMCYDPDVDLYEFNRVTPDDDPDPTIKGLGFSGKLAQTNGANLINFFLPEDDALGKWALNNATMKPMGDGFTGYRYVPQNVPAHRAYFSLGPDLYRYIRDQHEAMAFLTASRTKAVGADGRTAGSIDDQVDMDAAYGFGDTHSAEFEWNYQRTHEFYWDLMDKLDLLPD